MRRVGWARRNGRCASGERSREEEREVYFEPAHEPDRPGLSDFADAKDRQVCIAGVSLEHRLYHFALAYSGWRHAEMVLDGESWAVLSAGLQDAM